MHTENTVYMRGSLTRIYELAAKIEEWPSLLPHYQDVTILEQSDNAKRKVVEMTCVRDDFPFPGVAFPIRWRSVQVCEPATRRIYFKHLAGVATGMWVVWSIEADRWGRGAEVTIAHDLTYPFGILNGWFARDLVGRDFVHAIAGRTLQTIKAMVEQEAA